MGILGNKSLQLHWKCNTVLVVHILFLLYAWPKIKKKPKFTFNIPVIHLKSKPTKDLLKLVTIRNQPLCVVPTCTQFSLAWALSILNILPILMRLQH